MSLYLSENAGMVGLLFFFALFIGIAIWALRPANKRTLESHKYIPLSEDQHEQKH